MKKLIISTILMFSIIGIFAGSIQAASAGISTSAKSIEIGETINVIVSFGDKVSTAQFKLTYDQSKFEYVSKSGPGNYNPGTKTYGFYTSDGSEPNYDSVVFTFKAKAAGNVIFGLNSLKISTASQKNFAPSVGVSNTTVTINEIKEPEVEPQPEPQPPQQEPKPEVKPETKPVQKPSTNTNTKPNSSTNTNTSVQENTIENNITTNVVEKVENEITNQIDINAENENQIEDNNITEEKNSFEWKYIIYLIILLTFIIVLSSIETKKKSNKK